MYQVPHAKGVVGVRREFRACTSPSAMKAELDADVRQLSADETQTMDKNFFIGMDVGSTTVKAVVDRRRNGRDPLVAITSGTTPSSRRRSWNSCKRFETEIEGFRRRAVAACSSPAPAATAWPSILGAKFVQEVNAVSLAVEKLYPECGSVIELGGQDAKIIIFKTDPETGRKKKIPSMNDKCAGGTGAVIDKINAKLRIPTEQLCEMGYKGIKLHPVAGKCGVFAETDINGLQKMGVPPDELMASLFEAIVMQNLSRADARQYAAAAWCCCWAVPTATSRACAIAGRPTSPRSGKSAILRCPKAFRPRT